MADILRTAAVAVLLVAGAAGVAGAQTEEAARVVTLETDGFDWGWLGLLGLIGLAGLAGLRKKKDVRDHDHVHHRDPATAHDPYAGAGAPRGTAPGAAGYTGASGVHPDAAHPAATGRPASTDRSPLR